MQPLLMPPGNKDEQLPGLLQGVITRQYEYNDETFYFSLHPELYPEGDSLDFTGRYLAVLLSIRGLEIFYLAPDETGSYILDDEDSESSEQIEIEDMLQNIEGIHTTTEDPTISESGEVNSGDDEPQTMDWLEFDSEVLMLPLINQAITESRIK